MTPLVIMTFGRANLAQQLTWNCLSDKDKSRVIFAVRPEEAKFFAKLGKTFVLRKAHNLMTTRQEIWDHFRTTEEYWTLIDDDTKSFRKLVSADIQRDKIFEWEVVPSDEALNAAETYLRNNKDVGTCSPLQPFRAPRPPKKDPRWSTSLVVGCNAFASERLFDFKFVSNYCADAEMCLTMLSKGLDTVWLDNYQIIQKPPTKSAVIRGNAIAEWEDLYRRFSNYITFANKSTSGWSSSKLRHLADNPAQNYRMNRCRLLKDARSGKLKPITLSV